MSNFPKIELYHAEPIANSAKVLVCLFEKEIEFKSHFVNLFKFEQHADEYLAVNPDGFVPTLVNNGESITESTVINEYIDDCFLHPPLKPADPLARARMRIWVKWIDEYFGPMYSRLGWQFMLRPIAQKLGKVEMEKRIARVPMVDRQQKWSAITGEGFSESQMQEARYWVAEGVRRLEAKLELHRWTAGEEYSLADIATYGVAPGLPMLVPDLVNLQKTPQILRWIDAMNARPAVQRALSMPDNTVETFRALGLSLPAPPARLVPPAT